MGKKQERPEPVAILVFDKANLRNNTYDCEQLGLHLKLVTNARWYSSNFVTELWQINGENDEVLLAEWERHKVHKDRLRTSRAVGFQLMNDIFPRTYGWPFTARLYVSYTPNDTKKIF